MTIEPLILSNPTGSLGVTKPDADGLRWKIACKSGTLALSPGPGQVDLEQPLHLTRELFLAMVHSLNDKAFPHVTVPETHANKSLENTGYVRKGEVLTKAQALADPRWSGDAKRYLADDPDDTSYLVAGIDFRRAKAKEMADDGSLPDVSIGVIPNYRNKTTGKSYPYAWNHLALTPMPWRDGMPHFGLSGDENVWENPAIYLSAPAQRPDVPKTGLMVALYPSKDAAGRLALSDGVDASELHLTLAYLGDVPEVPKVIDVERAVERAIRNCEVDRLHAKVTGVGIFGGVENGNDAHVALISSARLDTLRHEIVQELRRDGFEPSGKYGFMPHITLAYREPAYPVPDVGREELVFGSVKVVHGDSPPRSVNLNLAAPQPEASKEPPAETPEQPAPEPSIVDPVAAPSDQILRLALALHEATEKHNKIADEDQRLTTSDLLSTGMADLQEDFPGAEYNVGPLDRLPDGEYEYVALSDGTIYAPNFQETTGGLVQNPDGSMYIGDPSPGGEWKILAPPAAAQDRPGEQEEPQAGGEEDMNLSVISFNPAKHPRDMKGRFREVLSKLIVGSSTKLPNGTRVTRQENGYQVSGGRRGKKDHLDVDSAIKQALDSPDDKDVDSKGSKNKASGASALAGKDFISKKMLADAGLKTPPSGYVYDAASGGWRRPADKGAASGIKARKASAGTKPIKLSQDVPENEGGQSSSSNPDVKIDPSQNRPEGNQMSTQTQTPEEIAAEQQATIEAQQAEIEAMQATMALSQQAQDESLRKSHRIESDAYIQGLEGKVPPAVLTTAHKVLLSLDPVSSPQMNLSINLSADGTGDETKIQSPVEMVHLLLSAAATDEGSAATELADLQKQMASMNLSISTAANSQANGDEEKRKKVREHFEAQRGGDSK